MVIFGERFRGLDAQPVQVEVARVLAFVEQRLRDLRRLVTDGDQRQPDHVELAATLRQEEVGDREMSSLSLPRKRKPLDFTPLSLRVILSERALCASRRIPTVTRTIRFVNDDVVPFRLARPIPVNDARLEPRVAQHLGLEFLQDRAKLLLDELRILLLRRRLELPLVLEERGLVDVRKYLFEA